ncbi:MULTISPECIES: photosystem I biogenesis protein BtpA [Oscillatoriales]|uniref:Photosystem I biogenesis protein BtpA n=1 Tax=Limnospira platensis NIES-46 TaxID=1236695 RepID=A0A5M3SZI9_LIMPL|nr:BtpA/SgcQ family protein [Arthrospira platensis]AMW28894.1 phosphorybosylanthranilate isomerase [Arthrospira platensis YZ]KDR56015.1 phosphorybosylanthranilate isomerase [Arthrospira platensis str. Paraca]MBD2574441.1 BtpA/SgcQ family protein [Arthrospira platensis FACHB-971]MBD2670656.1 BtpA/SgcQ family protein [Arthrospira platensis FACHB-439]MBD2711488.1 BtpA/SgcQ family protein [Arthrospira platensis FACHB-835]MDF2212648.1 BtpA/SgcQ family protein [Arthrospira platensis NCB002]MDT9183
MDLNQIFNTENPIIGVVHLLPLPTSPRWGGDIKAVIDRAEQEATALASGGVHGIIVENFFDSPFAKDKVDPAVVSAMTMIIQRLMNLVTVPLGVNVLRNDGESALAIASCVGAQFIRVNVLNGVMATDQGIIEGNAHRLLRYRRELGSDVKILADVLVKHGRPLGSPNLTTAVKETTERALADGIILSGWSTGSPPSLEDLELARTAAGDTPVFIGSGADYENISTLIKAADGVIVASSLKRHGRISQPIDPSRVSQFVEAMGRGLQPGTTDPWTLKPQSELPSKLKP